MTDNFQLSRENIRSILYYEFKNGLNASETVRKMNESLGEDTVTVRQAQQWFSKFREGIGKLEDAPRSGRPIVIDDEELRAAIERDPHLRLLDLKEQFNVSMQTVSNHLKAMGKVKKLDQWVPHKLSENDRKRRVDAVTILLSKSRRMDWLQRLVTCDEKWVVYDNQTRKRSWIDRGSPAQSTPKPEKHQKKLLLSVFWDCKGVIHHEFLPRGNTLNAETYCQQLERANQKLLEKRPQLHQPIFLHDNARPHIAAASREKLLDLGWEVLVHPPYSPDMAPTDFHLFLALQNVLRDQTFTSDNALIEAVEEFLTAKNDEFFSNGILKLPGKWRDILRSNGDYI